MTKRAKTMEIAKTHGGKRGKSGRKPIDDKKVSIQVYETQSKIDAMGGMDKVKLEILQFLQNKYLKL